MVAVLLRSLLSLTQSRRSRARSALSLAYLFHGWLLRPRSIPLSLRGSRLGVAFDQDMRLAWASHALVVDALRSHFAVSVHFVTYNDSVNNRLLRWASCRGRVLQPLLTFAGSTQFGTVAIALEAIPMWLVCISADTRLNFG